MQILTSDASKKLSNIDILVKLMEQVRNAKVENSRRIWTVYVFLVWYNVYFETEDFKPINSEWIKNRIRTA